MKENWFKAPNQVFDRQDLTASEKLVVLYLRRCANNAKAFPSYATIALKCSITRRTAIRSIKGLEEKGIIEIAARPGRSNVYHSPSAI